MPYDFQNNLEWDLVARNSYLSQRDSVSGKFLPLNNISLLIDQRIIAVGTTADSAKPNWYLGARLSMRLLTLPSSTSLFTASMEVASAIAPLNRLKIIEFPEFDLYPYLLIISPAKWHTQLTLEVWKYSGPTQ